MTVLDRVPVNRTAELAGRLARRLLVAIAAALYGLGYGAYKVFRMLLTSAGGVLYGAGWSAFHVYRATRRAAQWSASAVKLGWTEARAGGTSKPA